MTGTKLMHENKADMLVKSEIKRQKHNASCVRQLPTHMHVSQYLLILNIQ